MDTLATKTAQLQELFLKTQRLHDQLEARLDRLESVRQKSNVQRQAVQKTALVGRQVVSSVSVCKHRSVNIVIFRQFSKI